MKNYILIIFGLILSTGLFAQSPQGFKYQAVIRDSEGEPLSSQDVSLRISILENNSQGESQYSETHTVKTSEFGLISLVIGSGSGTGLDGDFSTIDWGSDQHFLQLEVDKDGGTSYQMMGTTQLLSVPYALYAETVGEITETDPDYNESVASEIIAGDTIRWNNATQSLSITKFSLSISEGNTVSLPSSVLVYTTSEISALEPDLGDAVFNNTENLYQIYNGFAWRSFSSNCWPEPTVANAGSDQVYNDGTISTTLTANTPEPNHGTGVWSIISGDGGGFADVNDPATTFTGLSNKTYVLTWSISTDCETTSDDVAVVFIQDQSGEPLADVDGNSYNTVWIGGKLWMAENLATTKFNEGTSIPLITDNVEWTNLTSGGLCWYDNDENTNKHLYGAIYNGYAIQSENLCPTGWHTANGEDWQNLIDYVDNGQDEAAIFLKATSGWPDGTNPGFGGNGDDIFDFAGLPGGQRYGNVGIFALGGSNGAWWGGTTSLFELFFNDDYARINAQEELTYGFSVRCVKD